MRLVVTGGAGFIGSNFVRSVVHQYPDVSLTVLDAFTYAAQGHNLEYDGWADVHSDKVRIVKGDIRDTALLHSVISDADAIIHFAAESHVDLSIESPSLFADVNYGGTVAVLEAARVHNVRLHHISTDEVFGDLGYHDAPFDEESPYAPSSPYSASKAAADFAVRAWHRTFGVNATVSICSNNYGPYQHVEKFIPRQITELLLGRPARLYGTGENVRDWIHVDDHVSGILACLNSGVPGATYLLGSNNERSNRDVVGVLLEIFGKNPDDVVFVPDRAGHDVRYAISSQATKKALRWNPPPRDFYKDMEELVTWYSANNSWWMPLKEATEQQYEARGQ